MASLKDETIIKLTGQKQHSQETIDDVEKKAKDMSVVQGAMDTARELSGTGTLEKQVVDANDRADKAQKERDKAVEDKHKAEIEKVEEALGAKIDNLAKSYAGGASKDTIAGQIAEIKKAANELGMGTSKVSELKEMMALISTLNPQKSMVEQIKDARELINAIAPTPDTGKDFNISGMPASIALELKKMDTNLQITLAKMEDGRQERAQEFELKMKQYDLDRADKIAEAQGKIQVEQDRNKMLAGGLETIGRAIGKGMAEAGGGGTPPGGISQRQQTPTKPYHLKAPEGESGEVPCPTCEAQGNPTKVGIGADTTSAECAWCGSKFAITRIPAKESMPIEQEE